MHPLPPNDDHLASLSGVTFASETAPGVAYQLGAPLGSGGMSVVFFAVRIAPEGETSVVVKVLEPWFVRKAPKLADLAARKEVTALLRLNERVPPTPFVVRLVDAGALAVEQTGVALSLPWLALEYVHGGPEGATLDRRVRYAIERTRFAFDPSRAALALECIAAGLTAVHEVGVVHRDVKPSNVLACGFGDEELFKLVDFGVARPEGVAETFGGMVVGTPGYAPPEQAAFDEERTGYWSDVFGFAAVVFFLLTGEHYFPIGSPIEALSIVQRPARRRLADTAALHPELRERDAACLAIDGVLAGATAVRGRDRPQSARALAQMLLPLLRVTSRPRPSMRRPEAVLDLGGLENESTSFSSWRWAVRHKSNQDLRVRSVAWDGDGRCLAATETGLSFWNGTSWMEAPLQGFPDPTGVRFVHRLGAGRWLIGGDGATMARYSAEGVTEVVRGPDPGIRFDFASGEFDDLAVIAGSRDGGEPTLYALAANRWMRPMSMGWEVAAITAIARIGDERWLIAGTGRDGAGYVAIYSPLQWDLTAIPVGASLPLLACAGQPERSLWLSGGHGGSVVSFDGGAIKTERIDQAGDVGAVAVDVGGVAWIASPKGIWVRHLVRQRPWSKELTSPGAVVSLHADVGVVTALTSEGGVLEGRSFAQRPGA